MSYKIIFDKIAKTDIDAIKKSGDKSSLKKLNKILDELISVLPFIQYGIEQNIKHTDNSLEILKSLPLLDYEEIHPWIERVWNGEENVLWYGKTEWFAKSSGTTNARSKSTYDFRRLISLIGSGNIWNYHVTHKNY